MDVLYIHTRMCKYLEVLCRCLVALMEISGIQAASNLVVDSISHLISPLQTPASIKGLKVLVWKRVLLEVLLVLDFWGKFGACEHNPWKLNLPSPVHLLLRRACCICRYGWDPLGILSPVSIFRRSVVFIRKGTICLVQFVSFYFQISHPFLFPSCSGSPDTYILRIKFL